MELYAEHARGHVHSVDHESDRERHQAEQIGLGVMTAAALLRTVGLRTWRQILMFTLILSLRILLKKLFVWEKQRLFPDPA